MRRPLWLAALLCLSAGLTFGQAPIGHYPNEIGVYVTETPTSSFDAQLYAFDVGVYEVHLVCSNPVNEHTGEPITHIGGFELYVEIPEELLVHEVSSCAGLIDLEVAPRGWFYVSCPGLEVGGGYATLATIRLVQFGGLTAGAVYLGPYPEEASQTIPGHMAIADADDGFSVSRAYPISGGYDLPVMLINMEFIDPIPVETTGWGAVKALYR